MITRAGKVGSSLKVVRVHSSLKKIQARKYPSSRKFKSDKI